MCVGAQVLSCACHVGPRACVGVFFILVLMPANRAFAHVTIMLDALNLNVPSTTDDFPLEFALPIPSMYLISTCTVSARS